MTNIPDVVFDRFDPMYDWARDLFPICRSLTGEGVRETLRYLQELVPELCIASVPSGTKAFDWTIPEEWNISEAYVEDEEGNRVIDFADHNLHVVGYSEPVDVWLDLDELRPHLHTLPDQPSAIPYITSYYERRWGFCLTHEAFTRLKKGRYHAVIKSTLEPGQLNYGEILLPGRETDEVLLSTNICHPSLANNELSGPVVTTALARWLRTLPDRRLSYRIVFVPETIGSIVYLSRHGEEMKRNVVAGFTLTCVGDERTYSLISSRRGNTLADRVAEYVLETTLSGFDRYTYLDRGSDERQYCSPKIDLPVASIIRSKYGNQDAYPEYHTSLDDLTLISQAGLEGSFEIYRRCLQILEANVFYTTMFACEPQLGKRGLYPTLSTKDRHGKVRKMMNLIMYADGEHDLIALARTINADVMECAEIAASLVDAGVLKASSPVKA